MVINYAKKAIMPTMIVGSYALNALTGCSTPQPMKIPKAASSYTQAKRTFQEERTPVKTEAEVFKTYESLAQAKFKTEDGWKNDTDTTKETGLEAGIRKHIGALKVYKQYEALNLAEAVQPELQFKKEYDVLNNQLINNLPKGDASTPYADVISTVVDHQAWAGRDHVKANMDLNKGVLEITLSNGADEQVVRYIANKDRTNFKRSDGAVPKYNADKNVAEVHTADGQPINKIYETVANIQVKEEDEKVLEDLNKFIPIDQPDLVTGDTVTFRKARVGNQNGQMFTVNDLRSYFMENSSYESIYADEFNHDFKATSKNTIESVLENFAEGKNEEAVMTLRDWAQRAYDAKIKQKASKVNELDVSKYLDTLLDDQRMPEVSVALSVLSEGHSTIGVGKLDADHLRTMQDGSIVHAVYTANEDSAAFKNNTLALLAKGKMYSPTLVEGNVNLRVHPVIQKALEAEKAELTAKDVQTSVENGNVTLRNGSQILEVVQTKHWEQLGSIQERKAKATVYLGEAVFDLQPQFVRKVKEKAPTKDDEAEADENQDE